MKKTSIIILIVALSLSMGACAKRGEPKTSTTTSPSTATESHSTATESHSTATESPSTATESPSTATESPSTATESPSTATKSESTSVAKYKDGNYDEKGDAWAQGQEEAIVIIKDGKISNVTLMRLDKTGKEIDYTKFDGKEHDGKLYPNLKEIRETMANKIVEIQSAQVDIVSGATVSTGNWKIATQRALDKAKPKLK